MMAPAAPPRIDPAIAAIKAARADRRANPPAKPRAKPRPRPATRRRRPPPTPVRHQSRRASRSGAVPVKGGRPVRAFRRGESSVERLADQPGGESRDQPGGEGQGPNAQRGQRPAGGQPPGERRAGRRIGCDL